MLRTLSDLGFADILTQPALHVCFDKLAWEAYLSQQKAAPFRCGDVVLYLSYGVIVGIIAKYGNTTMLFWDNRED